LQLKNWAKGTATKVKRAKQSAVIAPVDDDDEGEAINWDDVPDEIDDTVVDLE